MKTEIVYYEAKRVNFDGETSFLKSQPKTKTYDVNESDKAVLFIAEKLNGKRIEKTVKTVTAELIDDTLHVVIDINERA